MKIGFPVEVDNGLESTVYGHFGSAPNLIVVDTELNTIESTSNQDLAHEHGRCSPLKAEMSTDHACNHLGHGGCAH